MKFNRMFLIIVFSLAFLVISFYFVFIIGGVSASNMVGVSASGGWGWQEARCGDGFVNEGEQCDLGASTNWSLCSPTSCTCINDAEPDNKSNGCVCNLNSWEDDGTCTKVGCESNCEGRCGGDEDECGVICPPCVWMSIAVVDDVFPEGYSYDLRYGEVSIYDELICELWGSDIESVRSGRFVTYDSENDEVLISPLSFYKRGENYVANIKPDKLYGWTSDKNVENLTFTSRKASCIADVDLIEKARKSNNNPNMDVGSSVKVGSSYCSDSKYYDGKYLNINGLVCILDVIEKQYKMVYGGDLTMREVARAVFLKHYPYVFGDFEGRSFVGNSFAIHSFPWVFSSNELARSYRIILIMDKVSVNKYDWTQVSLSDGRLFSFSHLCAGMASINPQPQELIHDNMHRFISWRDRLLGRSSTRSTEKYNQQNIIGDRMGVYFHPARFSEALFIKASEFVERFRRYPEVFIPIFIPDLTEDQKNKLGDLLSD